MKAIGIKVLKDNLSKYLRYVREGETIWITDRDEIIAEIRKPTMSISNQPSRWQTFLNSASENGSIKKATNASPPPFMDLRRLPKPRKQVDIQKLMDAVKSD